MRKLSPFILWLILPFTLSSEQVAVYLTWQRNPSSTMTVHWISGREDTASDLFYKREKESAWSIVQGTSVPMPQDEPYVIHTAELENLGAASTYEFKAGDFRYPTYRFKTLSDNADEGIRFVVGGDLYHDDLETLVEMHKQVAALSPQFALIGGDIAYTASKWDKRPEKAARWLQFLLAWQKYMVTKEGFLIPLIPAIGNHDVTGHYNRRKEQAKFFYSLFAFPGVRGYNVLDFGNLMSVVVLDSNHTNPIGGTQSGWLRQILERRKVVRYKFALYHVPAYPCVKSFTDRESQDIRKNWVPLFDHFALTAAFENHDHAYKRSFLLSKGGKNDKGVLYLGDGAWGVRRPRRPKKRWFVAQSAGKRHFILAEIKEGSILFRAIDNFGNIFDRCVLKGG